MSVQSRQKIIEISRSLKKYLLAYCKAGEKIPSERSLAESLNVTHNRLHRAVHLLIQEHFLYSSGCRKGIFMLPEYLNFADRKEIVLDFSMPLIPGSCQAKRYQSLCYRFKLLHPYVNFRFFFEDRPDENRDLYLSWLPMLDCRQFLPLEPEQIFNGTIPETELLPGILSCCRQYNQYYGIPILHVPLVYWGHRNMLKKHHLVPEQFRHPADGFRWGNALEDARCCAIGFSFMGFTFHSAQWGVDIQREKDLIRINREQLTNFLCGIKPFIRNYHISYSPYDFLNYFHRGQLALMASTIGTLPMNERRFQLLGLPLSENGYACQNLFMLSLGKTTRHTQLLYEFIRYMLQRENQSKFFYPEIRFSVRKDLYEEQYRELCENSRVVIPPYDLRGFYFGVDLDYAFPVGTYLYSECAKFLCNQQKLELTLRHMSEIVIQPIRDAYYAALPEDCLKLHVRNLQYINAGTAGRDRL